MNLKIHIMNLETDNYEEHIDYILARASHNLFNNEIYSSVYNLQNRNNRTTNFNSTGI